MNFFGTAAGRALNNNHTITQPKAIEVLQDSPTHLDYSNQTTVPQQMDANNKIKFNDKTQKSLFKLNLFIKRLKWFNIFTDHQDIKSSGGNKISVNDHSQNNNNNNNNNNITSSSNNNNASNINNNNQKWFV